MLANILDPRSASRGFEIVSSVKDIQCPSLFNKPMASGFSGIFNIYTFENNLNAQKN